MNRIILLFGLVIFSCHFSSAQGYLHASGKKIVNGEGKEVILRGIGTGNWLLQEGYMMNSSDVAGTQHEFRKKLAATIGNSRTDTFYKAWLDNHFTRTDADSMKKWGFNSLRVAMHYKWLTLPIEEEPVQGTDTWLEDGFIRLDNLLKWCGDNEMYLILDLHGAPGGQGKDANISDYDPTKPSLWESSENRRKTVALWGRLAQRYANSPWIGGYDLINEPNWDLPGGTALRQLYTEITAAIRATDKNHLIFIEGNWFANDFTGLTPAWDNNMAYSGHKYWTYNTQSDLNYLLKMRDNWNVPIWLGETGENSNSWFTSLIELCETNGIGWSWWPVKKAGINNILQVQESTKYNNLINFWKTGNPVISPDQAFEAVMEWADNHKIAKCAVKRDVIDAMIRQPSTKETIPYMVYKSGTAVNAVNYDLGRSSFAYFDTDSANYHLNTNNFVAWNRGWNYRNDGVDIDKCTDDFQGGNGYCVGWTESGEWMQYTIDTDSVAAYTLTLRTSSSSSSPGEVQFSTNGAYISDPIPLPKTGGWNTWESTTVTNVILPKGRNKVRLHIKQGGSNINLFNFTNPLNISSVPFIYMSSELSPTGKEIILTLNKAITELTSSPGDLVVMAQDKLQTIKSISPYPGDPRKMIVTLNTAVRFNDVVNVSYEKNTIRSGALLLLPFFRKEVINNLPMRFVPPVKIEAEDFTVNNGFSLEECKDIDGGQNTAYANNGDYLDYNLYAAQEGDYSLELRVASLNGNSKITVQSGLNNTFQTIGELSIPSTGGWQTWTTFTVRIKLPAGNSTLRLLSAAGEYNINWLKITGSTITTGITTERESSGQLKIFPNPGHGLFQIVLPRHLGGDLKLNICDISGRLIYSSDCNRTSSETYDLNLADVDSGLYFVQVSSLKGSVYGKLIFLK